MYETFLLWVHLVTVFVGLFAFIVYALVEREIADPQVRHFRSWITEAVFLLVLSSACDFFADHVIMGNPDIFHFFGHMAFLIAIIMILYAGHLALDFYKTCKIR